VALSSVKLVTYHENNTEVTPSATTVRRAPGVIQRHLASSRLGPHR
jgi:hypothetical protein